MCLILTKNRNFVLFSYILTLRVLNNVSFFTDITGAVALSELLYKKLRYKTVAKK